MRDFEVCLESSFTFEGIPKDEFCYHIIRARSKEEAEQIARAKWGDDVVWVLGFQGR